MALHDPVEDAQIVPEGAIGATIDDEGPSKAKKFFTDPKNIATMLVLASALAQPRRGGRSPLAHGLRGGVGALAFRGGLDQAIHQQSQKDAEQQSIAEGRISQAKTASEQVRATTGRTEALVGISEAEITSREGISEADRLAGKFDPTPPTGGTFFERALLEAQKSHRDQYLKWSVLRQGPPPEYGPFLLIALQNAGLAGALPPGLVGFDPTAKLPDTEDEAIIDGVVTDGEDVPKTRTELLAPSATPTQIREAKASDQRTVEREGRSFAASTIVRGTISDESEATLLRKKIPAFKDLDDAGVIAAARQTDEILLAAIGTEEDPVVLRELRVRSLAASPDVRRQFLAYQKEIVKEQARTAIAARPSTF